MPILQEHVIICGFSHLGESLAQQLSESSLELVIVDDHPEHLAQAKEMGYRIYNGDPTEETVLQAVAIEDAKVLATVLPDDASNLFITLTARELNPKLLIIARGNLPETEPKLRLAGADHVVSPATISAQRMVNLITRPNTLDFLEHSSSNASAKESRVHLLELLSQLNVQIDELVLPQDSPLIGLCLEEVEAKARGAFVVIALHQVSGKLVIHPPPSQQLSGGDTAIVLGHQELIALFRRQFIRKTEIRYRGGRL